jgi:integrase
MSTTARITVPPLTLWANRKTAWGELVGNGHPEIVRKHGEAIGLPGLTPHDLRRTAAQRWYDASRDLVVVQELLGHRSPETTRRYLHIERHKHREAVRAVPWGMAAD